MDTSFSRETEGAFEVAFELRQPLSSCGDAIGLGMRSLVGVCDTANFGIDPIPSKYRASIADPDPDTCHLKIHTFK